MHLFDSVNAVADKRVFELGNVRLKSKGNACVQLKKEERSLVLYPEIGGIKCQVPDPLDTF